MYSWATSVFSKQKGIEFMRSRFLCIVFLIVHPVCKAQLDDKEFNLSFASSVHSMDEFFDRFNYKPNSAFEKYVRKHLHDVTFTREKLVYSLFNKKNSFFSQNSEVAEFVRQVTDSFSPDYIYYKDKYWYAELQCSILVRGKLQPLMLVLKVEQPQPNRFQWSVVSARGSFLDSTEMKPPAPAREFSPATNIQASRSEYFLSPVSHGIDFTNVDDFFFSKSNAWSFLYRGVPSAELKQLVKLIQASEIEFQQVETITYHLLQIKGWIVSVRYFNRNSRNSGWLIDNLMRVTPSQKFIFLKEQLNVVI